MKTIDFKKTTGWNIRQFFNSTEITNDEIISFCKYIKNVCYNADGLKYLNLDNKHLKKIANAKMEETIYWDLRSIIVARFYL